MSDVNGQHTGRDGRDGRAAQVLELGAAADLPVTGEIRVNNGPIAGIDVTADGRRLIVTNYGDCSVSVIDTGTCRVLGTIAGVAEPFAIASSSAQADRAYISMVSPAYDSIGVVDVATNSVVATHPLTLSVSDLTVSPDGRYVYASRNGTRGADVAVLDTTTGRVAAIDIAITPGTTAECVRISSDGA
ncbi:YncE family protein, partial [Mycobacterium simiae]